MVQLMWYNTKVLPSAVNASIELVVHFSYTGTEHWKALRSLIGYLRGKEIKCIFNRNTKVIKYVMFCNSNYATDKETRNSVIVLVTTLGGTILKCY